MLDNRRVVYPSYEEAAAEAQRIRRSETRGKLVTKVEKSPYGSGFVVRSFPVSFLVRPHLRSSRKGLMDYSAL
ncbi:MAG: hypothetical protein OXH52_23250 [Gammaproteobacteria bacterium]|nr:hypothetical protein [Gammaproteobacteria bacterium]